MGSFYAYVVSQKGAQRLLRLHDDARASPTFSRFAPTLPGWWGSAAAVPSTAAAVGDTAGFGGTRRIYQPVDLFVSHRLSSLEVYLFRPPPPLVRRFERARAEGHRPSIDTHTQLGIVALRPIRSTNAPREADEETGRMRRASAAMRTAFEAERWDDALAVSDGALGGLRKYPCWESANMLQNTGLVLLRQLNHDARRADVRWATRRLEQAEEAFASAIRYGEGTWMERQRRANFGSWVAYALHQRRREGLPNVGDDSPRAITPAADGAAPLVLWPGSFLTIAEAPNPANPEAAAEAAAEAKAGAAAGAAAEAAEAGAETAEAAEEAEAGAETAEVEAGAEAQVAEAEAEVVVLPRPSSSAATDGGRYPVLEPRVRRAMASLSAT